MKIFYATGRRKTSSARVFLKPGTGQVTVNGKKLTDFMSSRTRRIDTFQPLQVVKEENTTDLYITVKGGGITGQAEAIRHGLARVLVEYSADYRKILKKEGFLTRDPRMVERKKPGHHKARKSTQFTKR